VSSNLENTLKILVGTITYCPKGKDKIINQSKK
jgi:hypothetical protein